MLTSRLFIVSTIAAIAVTYLSAQERGGQRGAAPAAPPMTLTVSGFQDGGQIPVKFSQAADGVAPGEGLSPAMTWTNTPPGTQSFVLHMHDLDVARNKTTDDQVHWVVWNIPATATGLPEGVPKGAQLADGAYRSAPRARCTAAPARRPPVRCITTCSRSTPSTPNST